MGRWGRVWCVVGVVVGVPGVARAQWTVFDPANLARAVLSYGRLAAQVQLATTALKKLSSPSYRDISGVWTGVEGAMGGASGVGYAAPGASGTLRATYPGVVPNRQYVLERQAQVARTLATATAVLQTAQTQAATYGPGQAQLDGMHAQTAAIQGHEQALELQTTVGVYSAQELMLARQAIEAQNNLQAVAIAERVNAEAQAEADARAQYVAMQGAVGAPRPTITFRTTP